MTNKKNLGIAGLIVLAIAAGVLIYRDTRGSKIEITSDTGDTLKNYGIEMTGDGKIEVISMDEQKLPPAPPLVRSTDFSNTLTPKIKKIIISNLERNIEAIKKNPNDVVSWIDLGTQRKQLGDYEGARDVLEYAKLLESGNLVVWHNLGDLYHFYLKDYKKSEENWKKTIALKPDYVLGYYGLYELYMYSMTEKLSEVPALLKQGIEKNPDETGLRAMLAEYEKSLVK
ncbi:MAG: tetratricopeptide repeat protein [Minisyncoccia bacterium]